MKSATSFAAMFAVALLAGLSMPASAQETTTCNLGAAQPEVRVGDTWTYRWQQGGRGGLFTEEVVQVGGQRIGVRLTSEGISYRRVYDASWGIVAGDGNTNDPPLRQFVFPLLKGDVPPQEVTMRRVDATIRAKEKYVVEGCERVTVLAGTFNAVKITISGTYWATGVGNDQWSGSRKREFWYVSSVKRHVRETFWSSSPTGTEEYARELQSYNLKD